MSGDVNPGWVDERTISGGAVPAYRYDMTKTTAPTKETSDALRRLQAVAEPRRLAILQRLTESDHNAGDIASALGISPSLASHHLTTLIAAGFVNREQEGPHARYSLNQDSVNDFYSQVGTILGVQS